MISKLVSVALLGAALCVGSGSTLAQTGAKKSAPVANLTAPVYRNILYVSQETRDNAAAPTVKARFGPLTTGRFGYGMHTNYTSVSTAQFTPMPKIAVTGALRQETILSRAKAWVASNKSAYFSSIQRYMAGRGISTAYFSAYQDVSVLTDVGVRQKGVIWAGTLDADGRALYGDPKIVDASPLFLEAQYYPEQVGEGVDATEGFPQGGTITWRALDRSLQPVPGVGGTVDVAGVYDDAVGESGDLGAVACFVDKRHPGCSRTIPASTPDAATLANRIAASGIFAFFAERVELEYIETGTPGNEEYLPKLQVEYTRRELSCTKLSEQMTVSRSLVSAGALYYAALGSGNYYEYTALDRVSRSIPSSPMAYARDALVSALGPMNPETVLLSPFNEPGLPLAYDYSATDAATRDFMALVRQPLVPLTDLRSKDPVGFLEEVVHDPDAYVLKVSDSGGGGGGGGRDDDGDNNQQRLRMKRAGSIGLNVTPPSYVTYELGIGNSVRGAPEDNLHIDGGYERNFHFNVANPAAIEQFDLSFLSWDDQLQVVINGRQIFNSIGGDMFSMGNWPDGRACSGAWGERIDENGNAVREWVELVSPHRIIQYSTNAYWKFEWGDMSCGEASCDGWMPTEMEGCMLKLERKQSHRENLVSKGTVIDLRPHLRVGANVIRLRAAVGGEGEAWVRVRTSLQGGGC